MSSASSPSSSGAGSRSGSRTTPRSSATASSSRRTRSSRASTSASTGRVARPRLPRRRRQPQRPRGVRRRARGARRHARAPHGDALDDVLELYEGIDEPGVPVVGGDTTRAERLAAVRDRARPVGTRARPRRRPPRRPARRHRPARRPPAPRSGTAGSCVRRSGWPRGGAGARSRTRCSTSRTASRSTRATSPPLRLPLRDRPRARPAAPKAPSWTISASARTTSCSPRSTEPRRFAVIGRCEEGGGVEVRLRGEPVALRVGTTSAGKSPTCATRASGKAWRRCSAFVAQAAGRGAVVLVMRRSACSCFVIFFVLPPSQPGSNRQGLARRGHLQRTRPRAPVHPRGVRAPSSERVSRTAASATSLRQRRSRPR